MPTTVPASAHTSFDLIHSSDLGVAETHPHAAPTTLSLMMRASLEHQTPWEAPHPLPCLTLHPESQSEKEG